MMLQALPVVRPKDWNEEAHPRAPAGSSEGGEFTSGGGGANHSGPEELTGLHYDKPNKRWLRSDGKPVAEETAARLKLAGAKPAYTDVSLNPDPGAPLQAKGKDAKGRTQYMYSKEHSEAAAAEKFARLKDFNPVIASARESLSAEMKDSKLPVARRDAAASLLLIDQTGIRVGSDRETYSDEKAFGATTLLSEHVTLRSGGRIDLAFPGKSGVVNKATTTDLALHRYIRAKNLQPGQRVFATTDAGARVSMQRVAGTGFSPKDFRTWLGTSIALQEVARPPPPKTAREFAKQRLLVGKVVAERLNNTPSVALKAYIDPAVFKVWGEHAVSGTAKGFNEDQHPRAPAGSSEGGQFTSGGEGGQGVQSFTSPSFVFGLNDPEILPALSKYLETHGQHFTPAPLPEGIDRGPVKECYKNATLLVASNPELSYVEGFGSTAALPGLVFAHAWAVTKAGVVVDPTWSSRKSVV